MPSSRLWTGCKLGPVLQADLGWSWRTVTQRRDWGEGGCRLGLGKGGSGPCRALLPISPGPALRSPRPWKAPAELQVGLGSGPFLYVLLGDGAVCLSGGAWGVGQK